VGRECLGFSVRRAARILARTYDEAFAPCGLKSTQFPILSVLHTLGPASVGLLADKLDLDRTTLPRNLAPLERRGLIRIEAGADRRTRTISLTDQGEALLQAALPHWRTLQDRLTAALGQDRAARLRSDLLDLAQAADA
jgi:DNA-binding MarR family transcriptional regulator